MFLSRDRKGRPITCESSDVIVQIQGPDESTVHAEVTAQNAGKHSVTYTPTVPGPHLIQVTIRGFPMSESPFAVYVPYETREYKEMKEPRLVIGSPGDEPGQLKGARGITVDKDNRIIVCDRNNFRVQLFDPSGEFLFSFGKKGENHGEFQGGPLSVAVSGEGNLFVSDWSGVSVQVFDSKGEYLTTLKPPAGDPENRGKLSHVVVDKEGRVYVADCDNRVIYVFNSSGECLSHFKVGCLDEDDGLQRKIYGIAINSRGKGNNVEMLQLCLGLSEVLFCVPRVYLHCIPLVFSPALAPFLQSLSCLVPRRPSLLGNLSREVLETRTATGSLTFSF